MNMNTSWLLAPVLCTAITTCSASDLAPGGQKPASEATAQHAAPTAVPVPPSSISLDQALKKGMSYADLRRTIMTQGWSPEKDPQCKDNLGSDPGFSKICEEIPELSAYSNEGIAVMHFMNTHGQHLTVISQGDISDWKVAGGDSKLDVIDWRVSGNGNGP